MSIYVLIPLLPLFAFLVLTLGGEWLREQSHKIGIPAMALSFAFSLSAFLDVLSEGPLSIPLYTLIQCGNLVVDLGFYIDQLTVLMLLLVTGVSGVVHVYSSRYMIGDPRYNRFFAIIALFTFSMIMLVMSSNLLMLYIFWEIMGICSYLLISHWSERTSSCQAATKAFLVNAVADVGLGFGVILTFVIFGTLDIQTILAEAATFSGRTMNLLGWLGLDWSVDVITVIALFLFMGALGKSAQVPLHVWLPFAMEAPTPVSALIHAATMVNAGPFLLIRLSPLIIFSPFAMTVMAIIGAITALFAAVVSLTQVDIKKILAYSTISQIGFMIMTCGVGAFTASLFHLLAHGFFKGFLFLSTGNALRSVAIQGHGGSLTFQAVQPPRSILPLAIGALLLACLPPLIIFSGPYEALWISQNFESARMTFWIIGLATVFFTAIYLFRGVFSLFQQSLHGVSGLGIGEVIPRPELFSGFHFIGAVAGTAMLGGLLMGVWGWFARFLHPAVGHAVLATGDLSPVQPSLSFAGALSVACCGAAVAYMYATKKRMPDFAESNLGKSLYVHFWNKLYFDEIYECYVVEPTLKLARWLWRVVDTRGINGCIMGIANLSLILAKWLWRVVDTRGIDRIVLGVGRQSVGLADWLWRMVDLRGIDRVVVGMGGRSVGLADWLWRMVDLRGIDRVVIGLGERTVGLAHWIWRVFDFRVQKKHVEVFGEQSEASREVIQELEPRTLQHHLLVMIFWLILAMALLYWLAV